MSQKMISEIAFSENVYKGDFSLEEKKLFGKLNWYDWCIENWGTKWEWVEK